MAKVEIKKPIVDEISAALDGAAAAVVVSIPISILFVIMQRFYVDGLTGAVKG